jgi:hypothetical protein
MLNGVRIAIFINLLTIGLMGCSSPNSQSVDDINYSLVDVNSSIEDVLSMGIQNISENHREIYSKPFIVAQSDEARALNLRERGKAKVSVLGAQRPYKIEVEVRIERSEPRPKTKTEAIYKFNRFDDRLAKKLLTEIMSKLKSTRDKNLIDDFKPF